MVNRKATRATVMAGRRARRPVSRVLSAPLPARGDHSSGTRIAARLARPTRAAGRECPCVGGAGPEPGEPLAGRPYSVLLPVGFAVPPPLPGARCALAAPFHPCRREGEPSCAGGLFSVALSLGLPPPAVSRHRIPVEPGLSSTRGCAPRAAAARPSGTPDVRPRNRTVNLERLRQSRNSTAVSATERELSGRGGSSKAEAGAPCRRSGGRFQPLRCGKRRRRGAVRCPAWVASAASHVREARAGTPRRGRAAADRASCRRAVRGWS